MPNSYTTNYNWILPEVGADTNEWGAHLNTNFQNIDSKVKAIENASSGGTTAYVPIAGGTMTGFLTLNAAPTAALHAATKAYVDGIVTGSTTPYLPLVGGTLTGALTVNSTLSVSSTLTMGTAGSWNPSSGALATTGNISTSTGTVTAFGNIQSTGGFIGTNGGGITYAGLISGTSATITGAISGTNITASGTLSGASLSISGANTFSNATTFTSTTNIKATSAPTLNMQNSAGTSIGQFYSNSGVGTGFSYLSGGNAYVTPTAGNGFYCNGPYNNTSDIKFKKNIETINNALSIVKHLNGVSFNIFDMPEKQIGLIAQEVQPYLPEVVSSDNEGNLTMQYASIVAVLINAIKELEARVAQLEAA